MSNQTLNSAPLRLLYAAFGFLFEQRQQLAQLRSELLQSLSLFRGAWRNRARVTSRRGRKRCFTFVNVKWRALSDFSILLANYFQFSTTAQLVCESLLRACDRVLILVKQLFDPQRHFHVALAIDALAG